jgi:hypothetical protein
LDGDETAGVSEEYPLSNEIAGVSDGTTAGVPKGETAGVIEYYKLLESEVKVAAEAAVAVPPEAVIEATHDEHDNSSTNQTSYNDNDAGVIEGDSGDSGDEDKDYTSESIEEETEHAAILDSEVCHPKTMTPSIQRVYGLRPRHQRQYSHLHTNKANNTMAQYSLKKGIKICNGKAEEAVSK